MAETSKKATYKYFNGTDYETINFKTIATQVVEDDNHKFVKSSDITRWNGKANNVAATQSLTGLMSATDKKKLDGIATLANNYVHPTNHAANIIVQDATHRFITDTERSTWNGKANNVAATQSLTGLMSAVDKKKLDGIEASIKAMLLDSFHPVGSIYMSVTSSDPAKTFGGVWERWGKGRVPVGVNESDTDFKSSNKEGGSKTMIHNHGAGNLAASIGAYDNNIGSIGYQAGKSNGDAFSYGIRADAYDVSISANRVNHSTPVRGTTDNSVTAASSNLQPYITCYMWKRTK